MAKSGASFPVKEAIDLLKSKADTDLVLRCHNHDFAVHRLILGQKSPFFRAAFDQEFKEKAEGFMTIGETTPGILAVLILHCYINTLHTTALNDIWPEHVPASEPTETLQDEPEDVERKFLLRIYQLADRLLISSLAVQVATLVLRTLQRPRVHGGNRALVEIEKLYQNLPDGDKYLRPMLTSWFVCRDYDYTWALNQEELEELLRRVDTSNFLDAKITWTRNAQKKSLEESWEVVTGVKPC